MSSSERTNTRRVFPGLDADLGPALPLSRVDTEWLIEQVVDRALEPEKKPRLRGLSLRAFSLAALAVVTSAAAATVVHQQLRRDLSVSVPAVRVPQRQANQHTPRHALSEFARQPNTQRGPSAQSVSSAATTPTGEMAPPVRERRPPPTGASDAILPAQAAALVDELSAANDLRRKGQWLAAEIAYREIATRYPNAPQATVAQLASADLRLEHLGDAAGALRSYQSVPQSSALGIEALHGVSRAQRALGNSAAEAMALRSLLAAYPTSLQAEGARERLKQLSRESVDP
jgi:TolA-binding protein